MDWLCSLWNPSVGLTGCYEFWLCVSMLFPSSLWKSCPAQRWQWCWEINEHTGLWLGGTLQRHSYLRDNLTIKISIYVMLVYAMYFSMNFYVHVESLLMIKYRFTCVWRSLYLHVYALCVLCILLMYMPCVFATHLPKFNGGYKPITGQNRCVSTPWDPLAEGGR